MYAYGAGSPHADPHVQAEVTRMRDFWDGLVDIDREADRREVETAAAQSPETASARDRLTAAQAALDAPIVARRAQRAAARRKLDTPELDRQVAEAFAARNTARSALWDAMRVWRKRHPDTVKALRQARRDAVKQARQCSGLYWCNYNRVIDSYERGRKLALKKGRRMRYSDRGRTDGVLTVQIQRTTSGLGAAPHELHGAVRSCVIDPVVHDPNAPRADRRRQARTRVAMRVDAAGHTISVPLWMHRALPFGSRAKSVQLSWRKDGAAIKAKLCVTVSSPAKTIAHGSPKAVGIDVGWRLQADGGLRIATLYDSDGRTAFVTLPRIWMSAMDQVERLHGYIDDGLLEVAQAIADNGDGDLDDGIAEAVSRWRPGLGARHVDATRLHDAIGALRDTLPIPAYLLHWRSRYRHLLLWRDNRRATLVRRRREIYRLAARDIAAAYSVVVAEELDLASMARTKRRDDGSDPELFAAARAQRVRADLTTFRAELLHQADKHGAEIVLAKGPSTMQCTACGSRTEQRDRAALRWTCQHCGAAWDQDVNAAKNLLAVATQDASGEVVRVGVRD